VLAIAKREQATVDRNHETALNRVQLAHLSEKKTALGTLTDTNALFPPRFRETRRGPSNHPAGADQHLVFRTRIDRLVYLRQSCDQARLAA
jgi:hypothetical protein